MNKHNEPKCFDESGRGFGGVVKEERNTEEATIGPGTAEEKIKKTEKRKIKKETKKRNKGQKRQ
jgi:hypothetical protein